MLTAILIVPAAVGYFIRHAVASDGLYGKILLACYALPAIKLFSMIAPEQSLAWPALGFPMFTILISMFVDVVTNKSTE